MEEPRENCRIKKNSDHNLKLIGWNEKQKREKREKREKQSRKKKTGQKCLYKEVAQYREVEK